MRFITINIPIIDTGHTAEEKRIKMLEELDELLNEFATGPVNMVSAMEEFFDVAQVMFGFVLAQERGIPIDAAASHSRLQMAIGNARHNAKMQERAKERGWEVVE